MNKHLIIIGSGGYGQSIADLAMATGHYSKVSFVDDSFPCKKMVLGLPIIGNTESFFLGQHTFDECFVAIGNNDIRKKKIEQVLAYKLPLVSLVHPNALVSKFAKVDLGTAIMAGAVLSCNTKIGIGVLINVHATVDHDCVLGNYVHLGVGVHLSGGVKIGHLAWLKAGCCVDCNAVVADERIAKPGTVINYVRS